jgi:hypothetical protein
VSGRLFRSLALLCPSAWRERYVGEVGDLSAELLAAGEVTRLHLALDLVRSALVERARSMSTRRLVAVLSGGAALVVVVASLLATNGFGLGGSTGPKAPPAGWGSIEYGAVQVSFPPSFETVAAQPGGFISIMLDETDGPFGVACVASSEGTLCLLPLRQVRSTYAEDKPTILNGVPAYLGPSGDYYAPSLGVRITATGPLAPRIVDTLTRDRLPGCAHTLSCGSMTPSVTVTAAASCTPGKKAVPKSFPSMIVLVRATACREN